jgi:hypothetical protein
VLWHSPLPPAASHLPLTIFPHTLLPQKVDEVARVKFVSVRPKHVKLGRTKAKTSCQLCLGDLSVLEAWRDLRYQYIVGDEGRVALAHFVEVSSLGVNGVYCVGIES